MLARSREAYVWAWPMVNIFNRRLAFEKAPKAGLMNRVLPFATVNSMDGVVRSDDITRTSEARQLLCCPV